MNVMNRTTALVSACALLLASTSAPAETGLYGGIGVGGSKIESDIETGIQFYDTDFNGDPDFSSPIGGPVKVDFDEYGPAFKIFAGYRFLDWLGVEGGWSYLGEPDGSTGTPDPSSRIKTDFELRGWNTDLVAFWRFNEQWEAFAKLGAFFWKIDIDSNDRVITSGSQTGPPSITASPSRYQASESDQDIKGGLGLHYLHDDNLALRGELEYFDIDGTDAVWLLSFSALWRVN